MGIRGLITFIRKNLGRKIEPIKVAEKAFKIARLYIDFPEMIHWALKEFENPTDVELIQRTVEILIQYIKDLAPTEFLGIYFDGIPPLAKVIEQRARRYEMKLNSKEFNKAKITVGTAFLSQVVKRVVEVIDHNVDWLPPEIIISTITEPGEGEHKLFTRIRTKDMNLPGVKVIISSDTDSTVMCILNNVKNVYTYINHHSEKGPPVRGLMDVDVIVDAIRHKLQRQPTAVPDFVLMVLLTGGNDFTPWLQAGRDRSDLLSLMIDIYTQNNVPLTQNAGKEIIWDGVKRLMVKVALNEERLLKHLIDSTKKRLPQTPKLYIESIDIRSGLFSFDLFKQAWDKEIYGMKTPAPVLLPKPSHRDIETDHDHLAIEFLIGVKWTHNYFLTGTGPDWYYKPSVIPPLLGDLARVLSRGTDPSHGLSMASEWTPLSLPVYLLTILPENSVRDLVESKLNSAFLLDSGLGDLFPVSFELFGPGETRPGAAKGIIPPMDLDRLTKWVNDNVTSGLVESNVQDIAPTHRYVRKMRRWYRGDLDVKPVIQPVGYEICDLIITD